MFKLLETISNCSSSDTLIMHLCFMITDSVNKGKITTEEYKTLCEAYYKKGIELGLDKQDQFNRLLNYKFKQTLYELENIYNSALGQ